MSKDVYTDESPFSTIIKKFIIGPFSNKLDDTMDYDEYITINREIKFWKRLQERLVSEGVFRIKHWICLSEEDKNELFDQKIKIHVEKLLEEVQWREVVGRQESTRYVYMQQHRQILTFIDNRN